jgi:hypothetical protein
MLGCSGLQGLPFYLQVIIMGIANTFFKIPDFLGLEGRRINQQA